MSNASSKERTFSEEHVLRTILALFPPFAALTLQWTLWDFISPYAWFLFYPAVFVSSWIGGLRAGFIATVLATSLAWWFLVPPMYGFFKAPRELVPASVFLGMGFLFVAFQARLRTAHRQAGSALAASQRANDQLRHVLDERMIFFALINNSSDFIGLADEQGKPTYINPAGRRMIGMSADQPIENTRLVDYCPAELRGFVSDVIVKAMLEGGGWRGETYFRNWQTQAAIPVSTDHFMIRDPETGRALGLGTVTRDVSDIKRARDEVEAANQRLQHANSELRRLYEKAQELDQLKTQLFANVSHELRTPLTLILGPIQRLLDAADTPESARHDLDVIARNARTLLRHVNDLLDVAKLEASGMQVSYADTNFARLARFVASHFEVLADEKRITYVLDIPDTLYVQVDPEKLLRVLLNLLSNAFKFTPCGGRVRFGVRGAEGQLSIEVADSGPGIPADRREAIFERFRQLEGGATRRFGGTGLGLSIARDFVALHAGTLAVKDAPEGGALFVVRLPQQAPAGSRVQSWTVDASGAEAARQTVAELRSPEPLAAVPHAPADHTRARVLVVEDNPEMNRFICENLASSFHVAAAFDGRQGLQMALELRPDLVLTDMMMPELTGEELILALRSQPALERTAIVLLTAKTDEELRVRVLRTGAQDYLMKPFSVEELRSRIDNLLAAKRAVEFEARLASFFAQAPDGIFVSDEEGRCIEVNHAACRMLGYSREQLLEKHTWELIAPEQRERFVEARSRLAHGESFFSEWLAQRADGSTVPIEVSGKPLPDGRRQVFVRDISDRKAAAAAIEASEARFRQIVSSAADAIISVDDEQRISLFNEGAERIFGWSAAEVLNQPIDMLLPERYRAAHREHLRAFAASGVRTTSMMATQRAVPALRRDGQEFPVQASISQLVEGGRHVFTTVLRDMSQEVRMLEKEQFLSEISGVLASSLDVEVTLAELGRRAVRYLGDLCIVDVAKDGSLQGTYVANRDPEQARLAATLKQLGPQLAASVWETQQPLLAPDLAEYLASSTWGTELRAADLRSMLAVPMLARGRMLGALVLLSSRRAYDRLDVLLAVEVAGRAATALDNASLHAALLHANTDIRARLRELQDAQDKIRQLTGLLPVCAWCGRVRDDDAEGVWKGFDQYVAEHSSAQVSHGICPDCVAKQLKRPSRTG